MSKDSKYFTTTTKGEIHELKRELDSPREDVKKEAIKKVIAAMTVGKDVSMLFPDVVKCIRTTNLELKKLVYLYIMNYARTQPDLAILSVNAFVHDSQHPSALVRALAVRTMGCIRVDKITEYLCQPLRERLKDPDPYVRKTAVLCVAKVWDINPELVEAQDFLETLRGMLSDANSAVVANTVAALTEIDASSKGRVFKLNSDTVTKLLVALNECAEWGQIFILNALAKYTPASSGEAEGIAERVVQRLSHANSAVVLNTVRVLMRLLDHIEDQIAFKALCGKITPVLVTLVQKQPEIQYVALRNINLIIQKQPKLLQGEIRVFFCKYNDPIYVKMEKLEIIIMLVSERNVDQVLLELKEYASEVDVEFVRKAVRSIGRCAIKLGSSAERCIQVLLELIQGKVNHVVQEAIVVIKDIFRKYPGRYETIIATLCENLKTLDEPEAKASMIWIVGEYAERIENADELLESFLENFRDEPPVVQLQLLTAAVKLFLKRPKDAESLVSKALELATKETANPDLRDRGFVYWRLLSSNAKAAKEVVLSEKPLISDDANRLTPALLDELISLMSTVASVYHKPPEAFVSKYRRRVEEQAEQKEEDREDEDREDGSENDDREENRGSPPLVDLLGISSPTTSASGGSAGTTKKISLPILLPIEKGKGLEIRGAFARRGTEITFDVVLQNESEQPLTGFLIQFNKNIYRLKPASSSISIPELQSGSKTSVSIPLVLSDDMAATTSIPQIQIALKNSLGVFMFTADCPLHIFFVEEGKLEKTEYLQVWKSIPDANEHTVQLGSITPRDLNLLVAHLQKHNLFLIAKRTVDQNDVLYFSAKVVPPGVTILVEFTLYNWAEGAKCCIKTPSQNLVTLVEDAISKLLSP